MSPWSLLSRYLVTSDLVRRVGQTLGARVALLLLSVVSGLVIARTLGPAGRGEYAIASTIAALGAQFANMGLHTSNTYYLGKDRSLLPLLLGNSLWMSAVVGGSVGLLLALFVWLFPQQAPIQGGLVLLTVVAIPLYCAFTLLQNLFLGLQETTQYNKTELVMNGLSLAAVVFLVFLGLQSPAGVYGISLLVAAGVLYWMVKRLSAITSRRTGVSLDLFSKHFRLGVRSYVSNLVFLAVFRADILLVQHLSGMEAAGLYSIAVSLGDMAAMLSVVTGSILYPMLAAEKNSHERWRLARQTAAVIAAIMLVAVIVGIPLSVLLIPLLYGDAYSQTAEAFQWLLPGIACLSVSTILINYFTAEGIPPIVMILPVVALLAKAGSGLLLIPANGIVGAAIASSLSYGLILFLSLAYVVWFCPRRMATVDVG